MGRGSEDLGVVEVADGDAGAGREAAGAGGVPDQGAHRLALPEELGDEFAADVAGGSDYEVGHGGSFRDQRGVVGVGGESGLPGKGAAAVAVGSGRPPGGARA